MNALYRQAKICEGISNRLFNSHAPLLSAEADELVRARRRLESARSESDIDTEVAAIAKRWPQLASSN
jgi:hypothetical protein